MREIARSPVLQERIGELVKPIDVIRRIIERGQRTGEFRADLDPVVAGTIFYGGIDELLTAWVLGTVPGAPDDVAAAERQLVDVMCTGFGTAATVR